MVSMFGTAAGGIGFILKWLRPLLPVFLILIVYVPPGSGQGPAGTAGTVTVISGKTLIKRPGLDRELHVSEGDELLVGDELVTTTDSAVQMTFPDGDFLNLFPGSAVRVNYYSFDPESKRRITRVKVISGTARFVLFNVPGSGSTFLVETGSAVVAPEVLSDFAVHVSEAGTEVAALRSSVRVRNTSSLITGEVRLDMNERTIVPSNDPPERPLTLSPGDRKGYRKDIRRHR